MRKPILLLSLVLSLPVWAENVSIPTDADHPFDLTQGEVISDKQRQHFTQNGVANMYNGDQLVYTLDNRDLADFYNFYLEATKGSGMQTIELSLKGEDGTALADTTFAIGQSGTYALRTPAMKKGRYTLTLVFHQLQNTIWASASLNGLAFRVAQRLKPGDEVDIQNPEFDDGMNGWTLTGGGQANTLNTAFGNNCYLKHYNQGAGQLQQTVYNLPDGVYLFCLGAYDSYNDSKVAPDTYVYLNDRAVPLKTAFDDAISYRNIYRWYGGQNNSNYRRTADGRFAPTHAVSWNEALAMSEHLYENCVVATVTSGQATIGWRKIDNRSTRIAYDHARLVYLSDDTRAKFDEAAIRTQHLRERLNSQCSVLSSQLANGKPHAPQAIAEANALVNADIAYTTDAQLIDAILHAEHLQQRLQLPFYELTLNSSPSGELEGGLAALGIQPTDTIALKINGTPTDADLATLKTLKNLTELDLSDATLTTLPKQQFYNMKQLTWVTLPPQLESIGESTFNGCNELRDLQLPSTLNSIGDYAFRYTYNFYHAAIPEGTVCNAGAYRNSGIRRITLPKSMKEVPNYLCCDCYELFDIAFNHQTAIGSSAFENCYSLTGIQLSEGIENLNSGCFRNCSGLTNVTLPSTILQVNSPFYGCRNLTEITCLAAAPPYNHGSSVHGDMTSKGFTLYVPQQAVDEYQTANRWNEFSVEGIDTLPPSVRIISPVVFDVPNVQPMTYKPDVSLHNLQSYWGGNVTSIATRGTLTIGSQSMLSARRLTTYYTPFSQRSMSNRDVWLPAYTSIINQGQMRADVVSIDLRLYENCWEFLSFPFDVRVGNISHYFTGTPLVIYGYDAKKRAEGKNHEAWVAMTADSILHAGRGYIYQTTIPQNQQADRIRDYAPNSHYNWHFNRFTITAEDNAKKTLFFRKTDVEVELQKLNSEFAHNRSWNFIGNPYPCYYDIRYMDTTAPITVWSFTSSNGGNYRAYSPLDDELILFPGQAFFIQCPVDNSTVVFRQEGRQHDLTVRDETNAGTAQARSKTAMPHRQVYNLLLAASRDYETQDASVLDRTRFVINEAASTGYDMGRDAVKFPALDNDNAELYTLHDGVRYAIDERPAADGIVRLGLKVVTGGTYTLQLNVPDGSSQSEASQGPGAASGDITLIDHETSIETNLARTDYTFTIGAGTHDDRFAIRLGGTASGIVEIGNQESGNRKYFDLQGRRMTAPGLNPSLRPGIYVKDNRIVIIK